ncbi:MATE family efflux transporter [Zhengella mangrovi]|uniref:Multidrug export protein MepA n=1 Tax=Zhengella mangrovi TaxID=1982044 RepID=A0A2G1QRA7_9HYPH|nr:MATE family efflux transporter [Zhengella mangrovi]PHP68045.1 MATE family efflux transporter [Zhengella mangrovi]
MSVPSRNIYLGGPMPAIYARTALPIVFMMTVNGLLTVTDALFLGHYVGESALAAVTLMFPLFMMIVAFATVVASGMSSLLARMLGAGNLEDAQTVYASAHWLALAVSGVLIALYLLCGPAAVLMAAGGNAGLAADATVYIRILVLSSPLMFVLSVNSDALRNEGRAGTMAAMSLLVSVANIGFNWLMIAVLQLGVAGSAYGTVAAQALALVIVMAYRASGRAPLTPGMIARQVTRRHWSRMLALGAPQSLGFIGISLGSSAMLAALQMTASADYAVSAAAYGIVTRIMTLAFLPLLGLSQAMQAITGNNHGAGLAPRVEKSLGFAVVTALAFCACVEAVLIAFAPAVGRAFVADPQVVAKVASIMPAMVALFLLVGPQMMIAAHFQATGDAGRAAILQLAKPYLFAVPMTFVLAAMAGERGIWWTGPAAELLLLGLAAIVLVRGARIHSLRWGLFAVPIRPAA